MGYFEDKIAIVTGGASGIGRALCEALAVQGVGVLVVADLDADGAAAVAKSIGEDGVSAYGASVDVARAEELQRLVDMSVTAHGRLDFMFNNAGIALLGEVRDLNLSHWRRVIDVDLWGVIYGTTAAYHVMVRQGSGHIVNTASLGGLIPEPMAVPYTTAKHAVVGLSTALRLEAAELGVRVSVVCPGFVRTEALNAATYVGVPRKDAIAEMTGSTKMSDAATCAQGILRGVERNKAIITDTALTRWFWRLYRFTPSIIDAFMRQGAQDMRALRTTT